MVNDMKWIIMVALVWLGFGVKAQFSIGGGASTLFQFGNPKPYVGMHLNVEFPRNNEVTFYGRATYHFRQKISSAEDDFGNPYGVFATAKDPTTVPSSVVLPASYNESFNYLMIDGGTRYYLINGYDEGFSLYGGTNIAVIINTVRNSLKVDGLTSFYELSVPDQRLVDENRGTVLNLAAGITGGAKYTIPGRGSIYFDINPSLMLFGLQSNQNFTSTMYKNVVFNFNIGYRKEIY